MAAFGLSLLMNSNVGSFLSQLQLGSERDFRRTCSLVLYYGRLLICFYLVNWAVPVGMATMLDFLYVFQSSFLSQEKIRKY